MHNFKKYLPVLSYSWFHSPGKYITYPDLNKGDKCIIRFVTVAS